MEIKVPVNLWKTMTNNPVDISIVIVNYNVADALDNCLMSIHKANTGSRNLEIFVVDNNSVDNSVEMVEEKYPEVNLIVNRKNIGYAKANNIALKKASGKYILILNPDTILEEGTFEKMIAFAEKNEKAGAITSKLIRTNGKLDYACKRSFPSFKVALPRILGLSKIFPKSKTFGKYNLTYLDEDKTWEVEAICGAFMFIPLKVLNEVGYFDEDYFMYGEDLDLCFRIGKKGYRIFYYPEVHTIHLKGESTRKSNLSYARNFNGAMAIFVRKNFSSTSFFLIKILEVGILLRSFVSFMKRVLRLFLIPIFDFILLMIAGVAGVHIRFGFYPAGTLRLMIIFYAILWLALLVALGLYTRKKLLSLKDTFIAIITGFFVISSFNYFFKEIAYSREVIINFTIIAMILLSGWRLIALIFRFFKSKNITLKKVNLLVVGNRNLSQDLEDTLVAKYNILYFRKNPDKKALKELSEFIEIKNIKEVLFSGESFSNKDILSLINSFEGRNVDFKIIPTGKELILSKLHSKIDDINLIEIEYNINNKLNIFLKRVFDLVVSTLLLIFLYPFVVIRSKVSKKQLSKHASKLLLLPKVFIGKYSLVGDPVWYEAKTGSAVIGKRGLTGIVQVKYNERLTDEEVDNYSIYYAKNQSIPLDIEILLKTVFSFFRKELKKKNQ
jgi:hypothetical protein